MSVIDAVEDKIALPFLLMHTISLLCRETGLGVGVGGGVLRVLNVPLDGAENPILQGVALI